MNNYFEEFEPDLQQKLDAALVYIDILKQQSERLFKENNRLKEALVFRGYNPDNELKFHEEVHKIKVLLEEK